MTRPLTTAPAPPSGDQWTIGHGLQQLVVTEIGATIRSYTVSGRQVIAGFGPDEWSHAGRGQVLAPWPNRLGDGRYRFSGQEAQVALNEPERANAIHGLVRWRPWRIEAQAQNVVAAACSLRPCPDYPFSLDLRIEYRLGRRGLTVTTTALNPGDLALPFGLGFHPYLTVGTTTVDTCRLRLPAHRYLTLDDRGLPDGQVHDVAGTELDFTGGPAIGATVMDTAFTDLVRDGDGLAWVELESPDADHGVLLWVDDRFRYLMCFTGDSMTEPDERRTAVAVEPMTCPPDAFRSGTDLIVLEPGEEWSGRWGLQPR